MTIIDINKLMGFASQAFMLLGFTILVFLMARVSPRAVRGESFRSRRNNKSGILFDKEKRWLDIGGGMVFFGALLFVASVLIKHLPAQ